MLVTTTFYKINMDTCTISGLEKREWSPYVRVQGDQSGLELSIKYLRLTTTQNKKGVRDRDTGRQTDRQTDRQRQKSKVCS